MGRSSRPSNGAEYLTQHLCKAHEDGRLSQQVPEPAWAGPPLPATFATAPVLYAAMKAMVLDEALATVRDGMKSRARGPTLKLQLAGAIRAHDRGSRLGALSFYLSSNATTASTNALRAGSVLCLSRNSTEILAVVDGRSTSDVVGAGFQLEVLDAACVRSQHELVSDSIWSARPVASVLSLQRCADACIRAPTPPFMRRLLGPVAKPNVHVRFDDSAPPAAAAAAEAEAEAVAVDDTAPLSEGATATLPSLAASPDANLHGRRDASGLNASQQSVVCAVAGDGGGVAISGELLLLQGPPGTGKTTTLVQCLVALARRRGVNRLMCCAPSNRGVQELLERFVVCLRTAAMAEGACGEAAGGGDVASPSGAIPPAALGANVPSKSMQSVLSEDDVVLIGDADKVSELSISSEVFVHRIERNWIAAIADTQASLRELATRLASTTPSRRANSASCPPMSAHAPFAFCSQTDVMCRVRINHTQGCAAAWASIRATLNDATRSVTRVHSSVCRRLPHSTRAARGASLSEAVKASALALSRAVEALGDDEEEPSMEYSMEDTDVNDADACDDDENAARRAASWPCTRASRAKEVATAVSLAADALAPVAAALAALLRAGGGDERASEMLIAARLVFCTLVVSGCYLVRAMPQVDYLVVDEAAQVRSLPDTKSH